MSYFTDDFSLKATNGKIVTLETLKSQNFILYFYPKDNTSACTLEAIEFSELYDDFRSHGYHIYGVSKDTLGSHEKFKDKYTLPFTLVSDEEKILLKLFDVIKDKKMYGKAVKGTVRSTFVFKEGLVLIKEYRDIKAPGHAKEVLNYIEELAYK